MKNVFKVFMYICMVLFAFSGTVSGALTDNNQLYYSFDDGNSNFTTYQLGGNAGGTTGKLNGAFDFDGTNDYVATNINIDVTTARTYNLWFKSTDSGVRKGLIIDRAGSPDGIFLNSGAVTFSVRGGGEKASSTGYDDGSWHMVSLTYDGSSTAVAFVDGSSIGAITVGAFTGTEDIILGSRYPTATYYDGSLDEVTIYSTNLSATQITSIYQSGTPTQETPAVVSGEIFHMSMDSLYDFSNNSNFITNLGFDIPYTTSGKINGAYDFDGVDDYMVATTPAISGAKSFSFWINLDSVATNHHIFDSYDGGANRLIIGLNPSATGNYEFYDSSWKDTGISYTIGTWQHIVFTLDSLGTSLKVYENGVNLYNTTVTNEVLETTPVIGAVYDATAKWIDGKLDEFAIWNKTLTQSEITSLYASGNGNNFYATSPTPLIVSNITSYYSSLTNNISLTTTTNTNYSYILNGGSEISIANNTNSTSILLTGLETLNNITWISTDTNGQTNTSETFTIDITNPFLNVTSGITFSTFLINLTTIINYSDTNIDTCIVTINGGTTNCNNESYTLTSGYHLFNVTVTDLATNTNTSLNNNLTINPYHFWYFQNSTGGQIYNFTVDGTSFENYAQFSTDNLGLGNHTFNFTKLGYNPLSFTRLINNSQTWNETINISDSVIVLRIYDADTGVLLTGLTTITLIATTGYNATTTTGLLNISNYAFLNEEYQIIASHTGYGTETVYFTYSNQEILTKDIYMLNTSGADYGTITLEVVDGSGQFIEDAICKALEWVPSQSAYVSVAEGKTNIQGLTTLNVHIGIETYKFQCTKGSITATSSAQIIQSTGTTLPLELLYVATTTPSVVLSGFSYTLTNTTVNSTHQLITYTFADDNNLVQTACLNIYQQTGTKKISLFTPTCTASSSGSVNVIIDINQTYTTIVQASVLVSGVTKNIDSISFKGTGDISYSLGQYNLDILIPLLFVILGLLVGLVIKPQNIYISIISTIFMVWFAVVIVPSVISSSIAIFITFICVLMLYGGQKK